MLDREKPTKKKKKKWLRENFSHDMMLSFQEVIIYVFFDDEVKLNE